MSEKIPTTHEHIHMPDPDKLPFISLSSFEIVAPGVPKGYYCHLWTFKAMTCYMPPEVREGGEIVTYEKHGVGSHTLLHKRYHQHTLRRLLEAGLNEEGLEVVVVIL